MSKNHHGICEPTLLHIKASCLGSPKSQIFEHDGLGKTIVLGISSALSCPCLLWAPVHFHIILRAVQGLFDIVEVVGIMWVYQTCSAVIMWNKFPTWWFHPNHRVWKLRKLGSTNMMLLCPTLSPKPKSWPGGWRRSSSSRSSSCPARLQRPLGGACRSMISKQNAKKRTSFRRRSASPLGQRNWWSRTLPTILFLISSHWSSQKMFLINGYKWPITWPH